MQTIFVMLLASMGIFLGMANPVVQIPLLVLLYPAGLTWIGLGAENRAEAFRRGWLTGLLGSFGVLYWVALPVREFGGLPWPLAVACAMAIAAYVGLYGGIFALVVRQFRTGNPWLRGLLYGVSWYLLEWVRGWFMTGFPWMPLAAAFVPWPVAIQSVAFLGAYGLGGVLASKAALLAIAVREHRKEPAVVALILLVSMLAGGAWRLHQPEPVAAPGAILDVLLVQGNVNQNVKWEPEQQRATTERYVRLSESGLSRFDRAEGKDAVPVLVVWPETAMPYDFEHSPFSYLARDLARSAGVFLMTGSVGWDEAAKKFRNRAYLVEPVHAPLRWYEKEHLVPFGEYVPPGLDFEFLSAFMRGVGDFVPGTSVAPLRIESATRPENSASGTGGTNALVTGVLICYETIFPELARKHVAQGAGLLLNISNDAWFGRTSAPEQHLQLSILRAVEQGRMLARGTNTGISAFVDGRGRLLERGELFRAETLGRRVLLAQEFTLFYWLAPWLPGLACAFGGVLVYALGRTRRTAR